MTSIVNANGVAVIVNSAHATGTATDQNGNTYVFDYSNAFRGTESGGVVSGLMNDHFSLAGNGPANLSNGFTGVFHTDFFSFFTVDPVIRSSGDPIDFVTGTAHCDPL